MTPSSALTAAAAPLIAASALISDRSIRSPETGKFSTARWVCARHLAAAGTRTSPMESCSIRNSSCATVPPAARPPNQSVSQARQPRRYGEQRYSPDLPPVRRVSQCRCACLLYTSDAADEEDSVDLGGRRI